MPNPTSFNTPSIEIAQSLIDEAVSFIPDGKDKEALLKATFEKCVAFKKFSNIEFSAAWEIIMLSGDLDWMEAHAKTWPADCRNDFAITPAHVAAFSGQHAFIAHLVSMEDFYQMLVNVDSIGQTIGHYAAAGGNIAMLALIYRQFVAMTNMVDLHRNSLAHTAAANNQPEALRLIFRLSPTQKIACNREGLTPTHVAALHGHTDCIISAFEYEALRHYRDRDDRLVTQILLQNKHFIALENLLEHQADCMWIPDPSDTKEKRRTILDDAFACGADEFVAELCNKQNDNASTYSGVMSTLIRHGQTELVMKIMHHSRTSDTTRLTAIKCLEYKKEIETVGFTIFDHAPHLIDIVLQDEKKHFLFGQALRDKLTARVSQKTHSNSADTKDATAATVLTAPVSKSSLFAPAASLPPAPANHSNIPT